MTVQVKEREPVVVGELKLKLFPWDTPQLFPGIAVRTEGQIVVTDNLGHFLYVFDKNGNLFKKLEARVAIQNNFSTPMCCLLQSLIGQDYLRLKFSIKENLC